MDILILLLAWSGYGDERLAGLALRSAGAGDEEFCADLRRAWAGPYIEALWGWDDQDQDVYAAEDFRTGTTRIVVDESGSSIGYVRIVEEPDCVFVEQIALLGPWRRRGIGAALIELVAGEAGPLPLRLTVLAGNPAVRLYERLGFRTVATTAERRLLERSPLCDHGG